jgi:hypothetical protein
MGRIEEYCALLPPTVCYVQERVVGRVISIYWTSIISSHLVLPSTSLPSFQHRKIICKRHTINYNQNDKHMSSVIWLLYSNQIFPWSYPITRFSGHSNFFKSPQVENPLTQIGKFLRCAHLQIANPQIFMVNLQFFKCLVFQFAKRKVEKISLLNSEDKHLY